MRRRVQTLIGSLFVATLFCVAAMGQQPRKYPPFTLVTRLTEHDANDRVLRVSTSVHYHSSSGDWRVVSKPGYDEQATLYRRGRGVYQSFSRTHRIIKMTDHAPGCPLRTGEELRRDPMFSRTEEVLGFIAASAASASVPQSLRDAAVEAAYKATFKPAIVDGRAVVASGIMNYQFVLPKQLNGSER